MTSNKPYLIRAIYEWICDNNCTPYLYVNTASEGVRLPQSLSAEISPLILNISPTASLDLNIDAEFISFTARFSGQVFDIYLPLYSVLAIVAKETGEGLSFPEEIPSSEQLEQSVETPKKPAESGQGGLKIVK